MTPEETPRCPACLGYFFRAPLHCSICGVANHDFCLRVLPGTSILTPKPLFICEDCRNSDVL